MTGPKQAFPRRVNSRYELVIEPVAGIWNRWRGHVQLSYEYSYGSDRTNHEHVHPRIPIRSRYLMGSEPVEYYARNRERLERRLRKWIDGQRAASERKKEREVIRA